MLLDISIGAIFAVVIPNEVRSRVSGAFQAVNYGTRPVGALAGGALGTLLGLRPALFIAAIGATTGFVWLLPGPLPRFMHAPEPKRPGQTRPGRTRPLRPDHRHCAAIAAPTPEQQEQRSRPGYRRRGERRTGGAGAMRPGQRGSLRAAPAARRAQPTST